MITANTRSSLLIFRIRTYIPDNTKYNQNRKALLSTFKVVLFVKYNLPLSNDNMVRIKSKPTKIPKNGYRFIINWKNESPDLSHKYMF